VPFRAVLLTILDAGCHARQAPSGHPADTEVGTLTEQKPAGHKVGPVKLTDQEVRRRPAPPPAAGGKPTNRITYDTEVKGFGLRVTSAGARAFVVNYRVGGRERRITIGGFPDWSVQAAREEAKALKRRIDQGEDPMAERLEQRAAPTMNDLADRFEAEHLTKRSAATQRDYGSILRLHIRPELGRMKVADVRHADIDRLHRNIVRRAPYRANRTVAVLGKMLALAVRWEMRADNPARGIERAPEEKRERFLSPAEIGKLAAALTGHPERMSANAIRLLLLTGARRGEVLAARWSEFDLDTGVWTKPSAHTKQRQMHRVPLSAPATALLRELRQQADKEAGRGGDPEFVCIGRDGKPLTDIKRTWAAVCKNAGISGVRIHDLRHTFASVLASGGASLPLIGALLGHTQAQTTHRYSHLLDDPLRVATERVGALVDSAGKAGGEIVSHPAARSDDHRQ
jgi:integrase